MNLLQLALLGALIGLPLGFVMQRTRLCFNSAYREALLHGRQTLLRMIVLAVVFQMIALAVLIQFGIGGVSTNIVPFFWLGAVVGGFAFGVAMVYAEGCSSTVWYRVGNGNLGSLVTLIGFALGEWSLRFGPLRGLLAAMQAPEVRLSSGEPSTLPNALGINPWLVVVPLVLFLVWWLARGRLGSYLGGWNWLQGGLALGLIGSAAWVVSWPTGWSYGVGVVGGSGEFVQAFLTGPGVFNWGSFLVLSMPLGAFVAAKLKDEFRWQRPDLRSTLRMLTAGLGMGLSATIAGGCNIGHGFTGVPTLALSSLTATVFTFLGAWFGNYLRFIRARRISIPSIEVSP